MPSIFKAPANGVQLPREHQETNVTITLPTVSLMNNSSCLISSPEGQTKAIAPEYSCITPLRCLELRKNDPAMWDRLQLLMDHHEDERKSEMDFHEMFQVKTLEILHVVVLHHNLVYLGQRGGLFDQSVRPGLHGGGHFPDHWHHKNECTPRGDSCHEAESRVWTRCLPYIVIHVTFLRLQRPV